MKVPDIQHPLPQEISARSNQVPPEAGFSEYLARTQSPARVAQVRANAKEEAGAGATSTNQPQSVFSAEEREYFAHLFPGASSEANTCQTYSPAGAHSPGAAGSIVDRKG